MNKTKKILGLWPVRIGVISFALVVALLVFVGLQQYTFAASANNEHWVGQGDVFDSQQAPFQMDLRIQRTGQQFTGVLSESTLQSSAAIQGSYGSSQFVSFGSFTFKSTKAISGNSGMCIGCTYSAAFTSSAQNVMKGSWLWPDGTAGGTFTLTKSQN